MTWLWGIAAIIVLMALSVVLPVLMRFIWAFTIAAVVLLALHAQSNPGEAMVGYAALGGGHVLRRPMMRVMGLFG